jgi:hypothetical protein
MTIEELEKYNQLLVNQMIEDHLGYRNDMTRMLITIEHLVTVLEARAGDDMKEIAFLRAKDSLPCEVRDE